MVKKIQKINLMAFLLAVSLLSGCAYFEQLGLPFFSEEEKPQEEIEKEKEKAEKEKKVEEEDKKKIEALKDLIPAMPVKKKEPRRLTRYEDKVWLGDVVERFTQEQQNLPDGLALRRQELIFTSAADIDMKRAADRISEITGIPVRIRADDIAPVKFIKGARFHYRGQLSGLLDVVAGAFDASWSYDKKSRSIFFTRLVTEVLDFYAPPDGVKTAEPALDSHTGSTIESLASREWQDIKRILTGVMPQGSQVNLSPEIGKMTLTTTPSAMRRAIQIVRAYNRDFNRQIYLRVQVLELNISGNQEFLAQSQKNLSALLAMTDLTRFSPPPAPKGAQNGSPDGKDSADDKQAAPDLRAPALQWGNFSMDEIISTLRKIGTLSVLTTANARARNGRMTPIRAVSQQAYLSRAEPATVKTSFSINLRPRILPRGRVQMDMAVLLRAISKIKNFGPDNNRTRLPEISTNSWAQEAIIPSGATLLISGFRHERDKTEAVQQVKSQSMVIILITPTIMKTVYGDAG